MPMPERDPAKFDEIPDDYEVDRVLVDKIKAEALIRAGYCTTEHDQIRADIKQLKFAALHSMQERHVVTNRRDLIKSAVTQFELYQELLPQGPGVQAAARTPEEKVAQKELIKLLWTCANVGVSGFVQTRVATLGLVLCEADVGRTKLIQETGKKEPTTERGRFLTANDDLIMTHFTRPAGIAFVRAARRLEAQLGLVADRRPELTVPVAKQLGSMVRQAVASVPHADPKAAATLTASSEPSATRRGK